jgi:VanZ family protein
MARRSALLLVAWTPPILFMATIFLVSSRPAPEILRRFYFDFQDKLLHATAYLALAVAFFRAFLLHGWRFSVKMAIAAAVCAAVYGAVDEWHQSYVPSRTSDIGDWLADAAGAALLFPLRGLLARLFEREISRWES